MIQHGKNILLRWRGARLGGLFFIVATFTKNKVKPLPACFWVVFSPCYCFIVGWGYCHSFAPQKGKCHPYCTPVKLLPPFFSKLSAPTNGYRYPAEICPRNCNCTNKMLIARCSLKMQAPKTIYTFTECPSAPQKSSLPLFKQNPNKFFFAQVPPVFCCYGCHSAKPRL